MNNSEHFSGSRSDRDSKGSRVPAVLKQVEFFLLQLEDETIPLYNESAMSLAEITRTEAELLEIIEDAISELMWRLATTENEEEKVCDEVSWNEGSRKLWVIMNKRSSKKKVTLNEYREVAELYKLSLHIPKTDPV